MSRDVTVLPGFQHQLPPECNANTNVQKKSVQKSTWPRYIKQKTGNTAKELQDFHNLPTVADIIK
jgi:hypothetical protein